VRELFIRSGGLHLAFASRISLDIMLKYRLSELMHRVGNTYAPHEDSIMLPANGTGSHVIDLAGFKIQSQGFELIRNLEIVSSVTLPNGSSQPVTVNDTDKVLIDVARTAPVVADSAVAVLKPTWVNVNTVIPVNFGDLPTRFSGQLRIPAALLYLSTLSTIGFPLDLDVRIAAQRSAGDSAYLYVPVSQKRLRTGTGLILFDQGEVGAFLSQFSTQLPRELKIEGRALVNPPDAYTPTPAGVGSVGRNSSLGGTMNLEVPLNLGIVNGTYRDTTALGDTTVDGRKDYSIDKRLMNNVNSGRMVIEILNGMPVQLGVSLRLLDSTKQTLLTLPQSGQEMQFSAAAVDADGNVTVPANGSASVVLNNADVRQFDPAEHLSYGISLITTPGANAVRFKTSDYVRIRVWSQLSYRVNQ
jgi:hypothetical protein